MSEKIRPEHLQRSAYVYVRQSTAGQVRHHREGQQRQYELAERARQLGFNKVEVIDEDLGRSGSGLQERPGFGRLLSAVCQGAAGAVLALEASRLARNNRDWHHLVDLCALTQTLLIDDDGVYDPRLINDRLVLGLKGTMSEFELGLLRQRARQAYLQRVNRGEVLWQVPVGFVRDGQGRMEKSPDRQVQQAIEMVFAKFRELKSARQTLLWLMEEKLLLPWAKPGSDGRQLVWQAPSLSRVHRILHNPVYAGAFAFGRTAVQTVMEAGRLRRGRTRRLKPIEQWEVLLRNHHEGYISWEEYLQNQQTMANNLARRKTLCAGAVKKGAALLSGLLRCGRCGRLLQVSYSGKQGKVGRYVCQGRRDERGSSGCTALGSLRLDEAVAHQVLEAIAPCGAEAALAAAQAEAEADQQKRRALELALERARYEVSRARCQYDAVDPCNRLVAAELEARWNSALQQAAEVQKRLESVPSSPRCVSAEEKEQLLELGEDLPRLWKMACCPMELKKQVVRTVIEQIVVEDLVESAEHRLRIHWAGGVHTELMLPRNTRGKTRRMAEATTFELVEELAKVCEDKVIAGVLNRLGYRTGQNHSWTAEVVRQFRMRHGMEATTKDQHWLTLSEAARRLGVDPRMVQRMIRSGVLPAKQVVKCAPWVIAEADLETVAVKAALPRIKGAHFPSAVGQQPELSLK